MDSPTTAGSSPKPPSSGFSHSQRPTDTRLCWRSFILWFGEWIPHPAPTLCLASPGERTRHPRQLLLQHPLVPGDTLNHHTPWGKPEILAPSPGVGGLPHSAPSPLTWRMECDPRRDPAARRERLRSSSVAALKGGRCGSDHGDRGWGERVQREAVATRMGVGREPREPVRLPITPDGGGPSLQPLVSCFSPPPLSPLPPANFQSVGVKAWGTSVRECVCV